MKTQFTLLTLSDNFPDEESCIRYFEKMRGEMKSFHLMTHHRRSISVVMVSINAKIPDDTLMLEPELHLPILNCL